MARALEFSGRPAEALPFYVSALEIVEAEGDPINRGSILHHIGNCEAYAGRWQAAMHAYRKAAEQFVELEAVEFISNALGEAGTLVPQLDPLIGLPGQTIIIAGLDDIVEQIGLLLSKEMFGGRNPRVTFRKFGGIISLALHTGNRDLLRSTADEMYHRFIQPLDKNIDDRPDWFQILIFHIQWMIRFLQFLSFGVDRERSLSPSEFFVLAQLASHLNLKFAA
ncbi:MULTISPECIES: tetratricopeptide repeat protein [Sphingomonas]|uniref:Tetratricopeptide repeat protein n=1 Tax=Sphingomonas molluscorum TaxID=418184 RepID=A0ABU8Q402_9SPHN|nr:tetratricopeptide repeat protein [Sphingomonas sp. JUb134]MBM7405251.1 tetratricopeptide (TPR) repeat protein [Sphingomonas sp. JUb134]